MEAAPHQLSFIFEFEPQKAVGYVLAVLIYGFKRNRFATKTAVVTVSSATDIAISISAMVTPKSISGV